MLEAMLARLPTKEQHLCALGLGMEVSLRAAVQPTPAPTSASTLTPRPGGP